MTITACGMIGRPLRELGSQGSVELHNGTGNPQGQYRLEPFISHFYPHGRQEEKSEFLPVSGPEPMLTSDMQWLWRRLAL